MPILPPLQPFFAGIMAMVDAKDERPPAEARLAQNAAIERGFKPFLTQTPPAHSETEYQIAVADGEITLRVYEPARTGVELPCHVYLHGGGFWMGTLDQSDTACRALVADVGCVVVSVDYRLAPENKFPAAPEDCYSALLWVTAQSSRLGIDMQRISIGGPSAGGNLGAVVALMARDRGGPKLAFQLIEIPLTDFNRMEPLAFPSENLVLPTGKERYRAYYFANAADSTNPYASPLLAPDLGGLPPALVTSVEYDALQPEAQDYAERLAAAGVQVTYHCSKGHFHGSTSLAKLVPEDAAAYRGLVVNALRKAFATEVEQAV